MASCHRSLHWISCFLLLWHCVSGALFAVDLGSAFVKVSLIKPGRVPISVVHNELSKRKTAAAVAFQSETRLYGEDALALMTKKPQRVFLRTRDFLGRNASDPFLEDLFGAHPSFKPPYQYIEENEEHTVRFDIGDDASLTTEEILGSLFSYLKSITKEEAGEVVSECVIAVPAFFGPAQKRRIFDVANLADVEVLAVIPSHAAAALQYGIERDFSEIPQKVVVYDMGANAVQAALVSYSAYETKHIGKTVTVGQFEVLDVVWNANLGGDHLDWALVHHFAERFREKSGQDLTTSNRSVMKLKKAVGKTKHILSANSEAHIYVEELFDGNDFNDKITRAEFEELNKEFFRKAVEPLTELLTRNKVDVSNLTAVELIGGGTRVPKLQTALSEALGSRSLDKHLDGDEAVVMGSGLVAANLSTVFRLRQFGYVDGAIHPMQLQVLEPEDWKPAGDVEMLLRPKALLPYMKRLPTKRMVNLHNVSNTDILQFEIQYNTSAERPLPPGAPNNTYATYTITGIDTAAKKHGEGGKIVLHFMTDKSGLLQVDRAEYVVEVTQTEAPAEAPASEPAADAETSASGPAAEVETPASEGESVTSTGNETSADNTTSTGNETATQDASENVPKKETKPKKIFKKGMLVVSDPAFSQPNMTPQQLRASRAVLRKYTKGEEHKRETEKTKNTLESYIVECQNRLEDNLEVHEVTTTEQREEFMTQLRAAEDWLYMDGADASAEIFEEKMKELETYGDPIFIRAAESVNRPLSVEKNKKTIEVVEKALVAWAEMKPWLMEDLAELAAATDEVRSWLKEKEEEQSKLEPHETAAFTSMDVVLKMTKVEKLMRRINNKKAPKTKPPPANDTLNANTTDNTTANANQTEAEAPPSGQENAEEVQKEEVDQEEQLTETTEVISDHVEL